MELATDFILLAVALQTVLFLLRQFWLFVGTLVGFDFKIEPLEVGSKIFGASYFVEFGEVKDSESAETVEFTNEGLIEVIDIAKSAKYTFRCPV